MGDTRERVHVCRVCGNEQNRRLNRGGYSYFCDCEAWKERMAVLEHARRVESRSAGTRMTGAAAG